MALLTTFSTTPIVSYLYPPSYQIKLESWRRGEIDWDTGAPLPSSDSDDSSHHKSGSVQRVGRMLAYIRLDSMPALLNLVSLFGGPEPATTASEQTTYSTHFKVPDVTAVTADGPRRPVWVHGMRLLQLTDRDSSVMTVSQVADYSRHDPVVNTFRTVGQLHNLAMSGEVAVMPEGRFAEALISKAATMASDLLLIPWSETGGMGDSPILTSATVDDRMASTYGTFVRAVLDSRDRNVGVFFPRTDDADVVPDRASDRGALSRKHSFGVLVDDVPAAALPTKPYHIFLAYFGDHDDKLALRLVLQLCAQSKATATIVRVSETSQTGAPASGAHLFESAQSSLSADAAARVRFETASGSTTVEDLLQLAQPTSGRPHTPGPKASTLVVVGRGSGAKLDQGRTGRAAREDVIGCLGRVAGHFVAGGVRADLLVVQAKRSADAS